MFLVLTPSLSLYCQIRVKDRRLSFSGNEGNNLFHETFLEGSHSRIRERSENKWWYTNTENIHEREDSWWFCYCFSMHFGGDIPESLIRKPSTELFFRNPLTMNIFPTVSPKQLNKNHLLWILKGLGTFTPKDPVWRIKMAAIDEKCKKKKGKNSIKRAVFAIIIA